MFQFMSGVVVGTLITIAALNPMDAKLFASKTVDVVHSGYQAGSKVINEPSAAIPAIPEKITLPSAKAIIAPAAPVEDAKTNPVK